MRRLTSNGTFCSDRPPCERRGTSRPDRSCRPRPGADDGVPLRHDHQIADSVRWQLEACSGLGARQHRFNAGKRRDLLGDARGVGGGRYTRANEPRAPWVHDIRIGDRQDHPRLGRAQPGIEGVLQINDIRLTVRAVFRIHAVDRR